MARRTSFLWALNANWNTGNRDWNLNAYSVEHPNPWNRGNRVLSRYSFLSPVFRDGSF